MLSSRSVGRLAGGVLAAFVLLPAAPAAAASGITSPGAGQVVASDQVVPLRAVVDGPSTAPSELSLQGPDGGDPEVVAVQTSPQGGELAYDFDTSCARRLCTGRAPALNGTWTLRLTGPTADERTFVLRIPPAVPSDVAASPSESGAWVRWRQGDEPDLIGYQVSDASGRVVRDGIGLDACDTERRCMVEVPDSGGAWTVRAFRSACPGCRQVLGSEASAPVRAAAAGQSLPEAPTDPSAPEVLPPSASPSPAGGGGRSSGPDQKTAFTRSFGSGRVAVSAPAPRSAQPLQGAPQTSGSFDTELGYDQPDAVMTTTTRAPADRAQDAVVSALGTVERLRLAALSALLIGAAVWLRRWSRRAVSD